MIGQTKVFRSSDYWLFRLCLLSLVFLWLTFRSANALAVPDKIGLSPDERRWLAEHSTGLKLGLAFVPPHTMVKDEDGRYRGVAMDFLRLIEERLNIRLKPVFYPSYSAMLQGARNRETDIIFAASETPERLQYLSFTQPYAFLANKIFMRRTSVHHNSLEQLTGKTVAVIRGTAVAEYLKREYAGIRLLELKNSRDVIVALSSGNADAAISVVASAWMHIKKEGISNVEVTGDAGYSYAVRFASRNDWPELGHILEKALLSLSDEEKEKIYRQWLYPEQQAGIDKELVIRYGLIISGIFILGLLLSGVYWIRRLKKEMHKKQEAELALRTSEERFQLAIRGTNDGIWDWDLLNDKVYLAPRVMEILGSASERAEGVVQQGMERWLNRVHPSDSKRVQQALDAHLENKSSLDVEYRMRNSCDEWVWLRMRGQARWDGDNSPVRLCGSIMDITQAKRADDEVRRLAYYDSLTGIPNRERFKIALQRAIHSLNTECRTFAVLFIDLDHFKVINDTLGHRVGDLLLNYVARTLSDILPPSSFIGRLGGDEFAVLLDDPDNQDVIVNLTEEILETLSLPCRLDGHDIRTSVSVGISFCRQGPLKIDKVMEQADVALFEVKKTQRGRYCFHCDEMSRKIQDAVALAGDLEKARERGELFLVFQPQINLTEDCLIGCEALLRWHHPERGMVSPGQFIPLAEERGLIYELGDWVLEQACKQARQWLDRGVEFRQIGVNVSSLQLLEPGFCQRVADLLHQYNLEPGYLELEITETVLMQDISLAEQAMRSLNCMGICFSIDDFGTGYSSLRYLHRLPISRLKLAQEFVRDMVPDDEGVVVAATLQMSHKLNIPVIAEGIENLTHFQMLREQGCDQGQGYLFSKPVTVPEFEAFCREAEAQGVIQALPEAGSVMMVS